ncbi:hypothetical protein OS493_030686 [Desmophyllum pertusum]|uniref:Uncharacterized protein n=1 Tax=Desmophyllum pertusum TaxID=174260 RepID=A0A9W9Z8Q3_9CNID|nr:hypothetical protein OS493_030686 [Desmophyllum pertusum]
MNFFISAINDAVSHAKNFVIPNEQYALVDERSSNHGNNKTFFDAISKALRQRTTENKPSRSHTKVGDKRTQSPCTWLIVDFDSISKAIVASRQRTNRESSLMKPDTMRRKSFFDRVSGQLRNARDTRKVTEFQLKKLQNREKTLFDLLDNIVQSYSDDETFHDEYV